MILCTEIAYSIRRVEKVFLYDGNNITTFAYHITFRFLVTQISFIIIIFLSSFRYKSCAQDI